MNEATSTKARAVTVSVNDHPVNFTEHKATGTEIKAAAIAQGVAIEQDFLLFVVHGDHLQPIADEDEVTLHAHQQFRAVAPDDNS